MKKSFSLLSFLCILLLLSLTYTHAEPVKNQSTKEQSVSINESLIKSAIFAGGCFWCIESDFEKLSGVISVESGYTGGSADTANYKTVSYTETGHFEAVKVQYNPSKVSYSELVEYFWRHIDPTDPKGQFCDKGSSYRSAIFYGNDKEKSIIQKSIANLKKNKPFEGSIVTTVAETKPFYYAEDYHQDYYKKNPIRYRVYRTGCGRDRRVTQLWGNK